LKRIDRKIQNAIIALAGLDLSAWVTSTQHPEVSHAVIGDTLQLHIRLSNPSELFIETTGFAVNQAGVVQIPAESGAKQIGAGSVQEWTVDEWQVTAPPTVPHWSRENLTQPMYETRPDGEQRPLPPAPFQVSVPIVIEGQRIELTAVVQTRITHPEYGLVQYPLTVVPAICLRFPRDAGIVPQGKSAYSVPVNLRSSCKDRTVADVKLQLPPGWTCEPARKSIEFEREGDEATVVFQVQIPAAVSNQPYALTAIAESQGEQFQAGFTTVVARDLGRVNIYKPATHKVQVVDVELLGTPRVAYLAGSGDDVAESLAPLGVTPTMLSSADLAGADLSVYDVILVGCRAYAVRQDIRAHNARLLEYVKHGGVLIIQYQTPEFDHNFGPYPYQMGRFPEEVSEEDATVQLLQPDHPLLTTPNKITADDFQGWFEQRGSKFWTTWDDRYTPLLETHDAGQAPQQGGMLVARYGSGVYVYSAYAWYRQLPHGVPGAYRLFANLLSVPATMRTSDVQTREH
ncbi:MAG: hypothetical protein KDA92_08160, partial [Planctomycetales bacterium]|nr:hypothetical protein [Planctomycetales bacterium]